MRRLDGAFWPVLGVRWLDSAAEEKSGVKPPQSRRQKPGQLRALDGLKLSSAITEPVEEKRGSSGEPNPQRPNEDTPSRERRGVNIKDQRCDPQSSLHHARSHWVQMDVSGERVQVRVRPGSTCTQRHCHQLMYCGPGMQPLSWVIPSSHYQNVLSTVDAAPGVMNWATP